MVNNENFDELLFVLKRARLVDFVLSSTEVNSRPKVVKFWEEAYATMKFLAASDDWFSENDKNAGFSATFFFAKSSILTLQ